MQIIFRKSANTNAFGLRGYWVYDPHTRSMTSFAASADYAIGQRFNTMPFGELVQAQGRMPPAWDDLISPEAKLLAIPRRGGRMTLREILIAIRENGPSRNGNGICGNVEDAMPDLPPDDFYRAINLLDKAIQRWPKHSGNDAFPVPHPTLHPVLAYNSRALWDKTTPYGQARWELLEFLIEELK